MEQDNKLVPLNPNKLVSQEYKQWLPARYGQDYYNNVLNLIAFLEEVQDGILSYKYQKIHYDTGVYSAEGAKELTDAVQKIIGLLYDSMKKKEFSIARMGRLEGLEIPDVRSDINEALLQLSSYLGFCNCVYNVHGVLELLKRPIREEDWQALYTVAADNLSRRESTERHWDTKEQRNYDSTHANFNIYKVKGSSIYNKTFDFYKERCLFYYYDDSIGAIHLTNEEKIQAAEKVIGGEMIRFRAFMEALHGTLTFLNQLSSLPTWQTPELKNYRIDQRPLEIVNLLKTLIGEHIEQEEEVTIPYSPIVESYISETEDVVNIYEETTEVEPLEEEKVPEPPAVTVDEIHTYLGKDVKEGSQTKGKFIQISDVDRQAGLYIDGVQRMGKSSLLENLIYQDLVKGFAVIMLDAHGDLINDVIAKMPQERINFTYLLDITDIDYPFGINLFYCKDPSDRKERARTVGRVVGVFRKIFPEIERQQYAPHMLEAIAETFIDNQGHTLADIKRLLTDSEFRTRLVRQVTSRGVRSYWDSYNSLSNTKKETQSQPLLNKLQEFLIKDFIAYIVEQKETTIDIREAIMGRMDRNGKMQRSVLLIHLPVEDDTYKLSAELIGTMLIAEIYSTTFGFGDLAPKDRPTFSLYVDEFQNFATSDFAKLFAQGGKFGIRQTVAHQYRGQLSITANRDATLTATTKVVFRTEPSDSSELAKIFSDLSFYTRPERIPRKVFEHLATYKKSPDEGLNETVRQFGSIVEKAQRHEKDAWLLQRYRSDDVIPKGFGFGDATFEQLLFELELLLYEAMALADKDMRQSDRYFRVVGMLSLWRGFKEYFIVKYLADWYQKEEVPQGHEKYYEYQEWEKVTELLQDKDILEKQKQLHLVFIGGLDIVLDTLKKCPIGEEKETTDSERAAKLRDLEKGIAWVKYGSQSFVLDTFALSAIHSHQRLSNIKLEKRKQHIVNQTRRKYCRSRDEIEEELQEKEARIYKATEEVENLGTENNQGGRPRFEEVDDL
jgi:hypothetical protein